MAANSTIRYFLKNFANYSTSSGTSTITRFHSTVLDIIRGPEPENPDEHHFNILPYTVLAYNNSANKTHSFTPFQLIFGHTADPPKTYFNFQQLICKHFRDLNNRISHYYKLLAKEQRAKKKRQKPNSTITFHPKLPSW